MVFVSRLFAANWRSFLRVACRRDKCVRSPGARDDENLSTGIWWLTFLLQSSALKRCKQWVCASSTNSESEQRALVSPVGGQSRSVAHQLFGAEVVRLMTVDNCRGDVGCKPGQPQDCID